MAKVAIGDTEHGGVLQTRWLEANIRYGPGHPSLRTETAHQSYKKYGALFGRFLKHYTNDEFLEALRKELQDG